MGSTVGGCGRASGDLAHALPGCRSPRGLTARERWARKRRAPSVAIGLRAEAAPVPNQEEVGMRGPRWCRGHDRGDRRRWSVISRAGCPSRKRRPTGCGDGCPGYRRRPSLTPRRDSHGGALRARGRRPLHPHWGHRRVPHPERASHHVRPCRGRSSAHTGGSGWCRRSARMRSPCGLEPWVYRGLGSVPAARQRRRGQWGVWWLCLAAARAVRRWWQGFRGQQAGNGIGALPGR